MKRAEAERQTRELRTWSRRDNRIGRPEGAAGTTVQDSRRRGSEEKEPRDSPFTSRLSRRSPLQRWSGAFQRGDPNVAIRSRKRSRWENRAVPHQSTGRSRIGAQGGPSWEHRAVPHRSISARGAGASGRHRPVKNENQLAAPSPRQHRTREKNRRCSLSLKGRFSEPGILDLAKGSVKCGNTGSAHKNPTGLSAMQAVKKRLRTRSSKTKTESRSKWTQRERPRLPTQLRNVRRTRGSRQTRSFPGQESWGREYTFCFSRQSARLCGDTHTAAALPMWSPVTTGRLTLQKTHRQPHGDRETTNPKLSLTNTKTRETRRAARVS